MFSKDILRALSSLNELKWRTALKGIISGFLSGLLVVFYRVGVEYGNGKATLIFSYLKSNPVMILPWLAAAASAGFFIAWLVKLEPMASGSGIPQVKGQLLLGMRIKWYSVLAVRLAGGLISSFFGLSLGREGPSIQLGASVSQAVSKKISKNKLEENFLITGGAAAGLSAAFNAPLSGIVFALEEVHRSFSPLVLLAATTASLTADIVSKLILGLNPVLCFVHTPLFPVSLYIWLIPLGIVSGLVGALINKTLLWLQTLYGKLPPRVSPLLAILISLPCGLFLPAVLGGGQGLVEIAEKAGAGLTLLIILFAVKLIFTGTSFGSGVPGGIFLPILAIGAVSGSIVGSVAVHLGVPERFIADFAVCAMAGALAGSVKAPITSILLTTEMTGSLVHLLPVAACCFIALLVSDILKVPPIYEALLERITVKDEVRLKKKAGCIAEIPVELGSVAAGKTVREIPWPEGFLVVGICRGEKNIVPRGGTKIQAGDYLMVMSSECTFDCLNSRLKALCHANDGS